ncbi:MAG: HEAT repeat domain-containing protein [Nitrospira sp. NTP1]|nr:HEAT repeat domain-containing protein [Nitrospira sp. NTP1]
MRSSSWQPVRRLPIPKNIQSRSIRLRWCRNLGGRCRASRPRSGCWIRKRRMRTGRPRLANCTSRAAGLRPWWYGASAPILMAVNVMPIMGIVRWVMAQALDDLLDSLEDPDDATREEAAKALAQLANPTTLDALIGACGDEYWSVRTRAGWGVAKIGGPKAIEARARARWIGSWRR